MENTPRKASDILLNLELKIESLLGIISAQDLSIRIISNKLNSVMQNIEKLSNVPKITVESPSFATQAVAQVQNNPLLEDDRQIKIVSMSNLPLETTPQGFRRSSRPETFEGDDSYLKQPQANIKFPVQIPEIVVPEQATAPQQKIPQSKQPQPNVPKASQNAVPVSQRVVDKNGKSVFLASVHITNGDTGEEVYKTKTNGTGKWSAPLSPGNYKVMVRKGESLTKEKAESIQDVIVDGTTSPLLLRTMIIM